MNIIKVDAQTGHEELLSINEFITECPDISTSPFWAGNLNKTRTKREVHGKDRRRRCGDHGTRPCDSLWQCNDGTNVYDERDLNSSNILGQRKKIY